MGGDEEEGGHEGHEGDEEESSHQGHEGDEEEGGHEGHEGDEEEVCEQDREGQPCQIDGAPWYQGEDRWRHDSQGSHQEQVLQGCEQEEVCLCQEVPMDPGNLKGAQGLEDHWLLRHQEGHTAVCQRSSTTSKRCASTREDGAPGVGISTAVERLIHRLLPIAVTD